MTSKDIKHTPGPWATHAQGEANHYAVILDHERWLAAIQFNGELLEAKQAANARLISAAPDLLKALNGVMDILELAESRASGNPEWSHIGPCVAVARAAIAKATGESE